MRLAGWVLAANALGLLAAVALGATVSDAAQDVAQRIALFCGLG